MSIRLVTYNIRLGIQQGLPAIAAAVAHERPDVLALQEVGRNWVMGPAGHATAELAAALGLDHYVFVPSLTRGAAHYGHALLSALPILRASFFRLPIDIDEPRTLLETHLEHATGTVRVVSTHLSHIGDRPPQGEVLLQVLSERPELPTVVMGDLNATDDDGFLVDLLSRTADADPSARPTFPASAPERRIDYILARDGSLSDTEIGENTAASDHVYVASSWSWTG